MLDLGKILNKELLALVNILEQDLGSGFLVFIKDVNDKEESILILTSYCQYKIYLSNIPDSVSEIVRDSDLVNKTIKISEKTLL